MPSLLHSSKLTRTLLISGALALGGLMGTAHAVSVSGACGQALWTFDDSGASGGGDPSGGGWVSASASQNVNTGVLTVSVTMDISLKVTNALSIVVTNGDTPSANGSAAIVILEGGTYKVFPYSFNPTVTTALGSPLTSGGYTESTGGSQKTFTVSLDANAINASFTNQIGIGFPLNASCKGGGNDQFNPYKIGLWIRSFAGTAGTWVGTTWTVNYSQGVGMYDWVEPFGIPCCPLVITNTPAIPSTLTVGTAISTSTFKACWHIGTVSWSVASGSLPPGLTLSGNQISGTPNTPGTYAFCVEGYDALGTCTGQKCFTVTVTCTAPTVTVPGSLSGTACSSHTTNLTASGGNGTYTWSVPSGTLPPGLNISGSTLTGTPSAAGTYNFVLRATSGGCNGDKAITFTVTCPTITITTAATLPAGTSGVSYGPVTLAATGGGSTKTWSLANGSSLPTGLSLGSSSGQISGVPSVSGSFSFTIVVTDQCGCTAQKTFNLTIASPNCTFTSLTIPSGTCNNNGTPADTSDDYYSTNVSVAFTNRPSAGNLTLASSTGIHPSNTATLTLPATSTTTSTSHTFTGVRIRADATTHTFTATFTDPSTGCNISANSTAVSACSNACTITSFNIPAGTCNNNGTPANAADDYHTTTVTVFFTSRPSTGNLTLSSSGIHSTNTGSTSVAVGSTTTTTSHNFTNIRLKADGTNYSIIATFTDPTNGCTGSDFTPAVSACSPQCTITSLNIPSGTCNNNGTPSTTTDDYFLSNVTINFTSRPTSGNLTLSGASAIHPSNTGSTSVAATSTNTSTSHTFSNVWLRANGTANALTATFTDPTSGCTNSASTPVVSHCSGACTITSISIPQGTCDNNGTPSDQTDDYHLTNITINFTSRPSSGNLTISGASAIHPSNTGSTSVAATSTNTSTSHTFTNIWLRANASSSTLTATFTDPTSGCSNSASTPAVVNCSNPCAISQITVTQGACNNNGTPANSADDYYPATVAITFANKPASGTLDLSGIAIYSGSYSVAVGSTSTGTTHSFTNVLLKANGVGNQLIATFSADPSCTNSTTSTSMANCSSVPSCSMSAITVTQGSCNNNGTPANTADDYYLATVQLTFANKPATGTLDLGGVAIYSGTYSVAVGSTTTSTSHTFSNVQLKANGVANSLSGTFSADNACTISTTSATSMANCSSSPACSISAITVTQGACNNNGTPSITTDDYYLATVQLTFANKPASGTLDLSGIAIYGGSYTVPVASTTTATSHTFSNVQLKANGLANSLSGTFSADPACTLSTTTGTSMANCSTGGGSCPSGLCAPLTMTKL